MRNEARRYVISFMVVLLVGVAYAQQSQTNEADDVALKDSQKNIQISNTNDPKESDKKEEKDGNEKATVTKEDTEAKAEAEAEAAAAAAEAKKSKARSFRATAYCLKGKTASGKRVKRGLIAADPRVLPLGTKVELTAGKYSGEYLVADTGGLVKGSKIDIWVPSCGEARRWGKRNVKLTVISKPTGRRR